ncbi:tetratricopeptide repeat protein [Glycomyces sp. TRM65418]|uniref:AfsR/SARP family transcriptional regulator n=1 Tax=Glycomyces sp. TRM65418 TaxID=2867006 RepID=UPI001CE69E7D|nr:BTAD domain-containing putative transcriptional regulator [Glycomyces sp. TRM65418]MCC3765930.1 tetratricopeptide repeat protein [Glycomyces sp. TRM65418]QZD55512.1 tetratricopeptide repeat protein [Glycomyces sp. TRM65418]
MVDKIDFKVLGPLEVHIGGEPGPRLSPIRRRLLALLLARAGTPVGVDALTASLWPEAPPPSANATLQVHIHRIRRALGDAERIERGPGGYKIAVTAEELDVLRFTELFERSRGERSRGELEAAIGSLEQGLELWRGEPYADIEPMGLIAAEVNRLTEQRLVAWQALHEIGLDLGLHHGSIAPLRELARAHPYTERFNVLLMLALYRSGRHAEALEVFRAHRDRLVSELGIEPGELMQRVHRAVLRADDRLADVATSSLEGSWRPVRRKAVGAAQAPVPRELPIPPHRFTGRDDELRFLHGLAGSDDVAEPVPIAVVTGMGGIGKTALAVHWAHRVTERFPDGQLFIDLRGHGEGPALRPIEALTALLGSLGVPPAHVPLDADQAAARFRTQIGTRRMLIVLDNAASAEQVRPLLPGSAGCMVLVTSRHRLADLIAWHGGSRLTLDPLSSEDAQTLVTGLLRRGSTDAAEVAKLAELCGRLPLALRIAAANLAEGARPDVAGYIAKLSEDGLLASLRVDGSQDTAIRAVFESSYRVMPDAARRLFRLLGLAPGPDLSLEAAASLAATSTEEVKPLLDQLAAAHLLDHHRPGRYRLHDLLRLYARERAEAEDAPRLRADAVERLLGWYVRGADACRQRLYPILVGLPAQAAEGERWEPTADEAAAWLNIELGNLSAAVQHAAEHGPHHVAWRLADALRGYMWLSMHGGESVRIGRAALEAAKRADHALGQAAAELGLATALTRSSMTAEAMAHSERASRLAAEAGWTTGQAAAEHILAVGCYQTGRLREGLVHGTAAWRSNRKSRQARSQSANLITLGNLHCCLGRLDTAVELCREQLRTAAEAEDDTCKASALIDLADVNHLRGRLDLADEYMKAAFELEASRANVVQYCDLFRIAAGIHLAAGRPDEALANARKALADLPEFPSPRLEASVVCTLGTVLDALGEHREAIARYDRALELTAQDSMDHRLKAQLGHAKAMYRLGEADQARNGAARTLVEARASEFRIVEGQTRNLLAKIELGEGRPAAAAEHAEEALRVNRETGHRLGEAEAHRVTAEIRRVEGRPEAAGRHRMRAREIYRDTGAAIPADLSD